MILTCAQFICSWEHSWCSEVKLLSDSASRNRNTRAVAQRFNWSMTRLRVSGGTFDDHEQQATVPPPSFHTHQQLWHQRWDVPLFEELLRDIHSNQPQEEGFFLSSRNTQVPLNWRPHMYLFSAVSLRAFVVSLFRLLFCSAVSRDAAQNYITLDCVFL